MQIWTTPAPLVLPIAFATTSRVELVFEELRRDDGSFTAYVFLNPQPLPPDAGRDHPSFAGAFTIFAPSNCWGDEGHCDWKVPPVSPYDRRPPHHLTPIDRALDITRAIRRLSDPAELTVTVHARRAAEPDATEGVLRFARLSAYAYQTDGVA